MKRLLPLLILAAGHMVVDIYPGLLSPLLPVFTGRYGWSITHAGILVTILQVACNLSQPVVALINDHRPMRRLLWLGLLFSGLPFAFVLAIDDFTLMAAALVVCGLGVGMFHPVSAVAAGREASGSRSGLKMAVFSSGGVIGFMSAPMVAVLFVEVLGDRWMPLIVLPAIVAAVLLARDRRITLPEGHGYSLPEWFAALFSSGIELFVLWLVSSFRAMVHMLMSAFLPMLMMARGYTYAQSAACLSAELFFGMIGMFLGGHLADRHGRRKIMAITMLATGPLLYGFLFTTGALSLVFLFLGMGALSSTIPVNIILAQRAAPKLAAVASSLVMGLSFVMGALAATPFGMLADRVGIETAMTVPLVLPLLGGTSVFFIKND